MSFQITITIPVKKGQRACPSGPDCPLLHESFCAWPNGMHYPENVALDYAGIWHKNVLLHRHVTCIKAERNDRTAEQEKETK